MTDLKAVIWDFGGVLTASPFEAFARMERERGLPEGFLRAVNARNPDTNAWARLERSELMPDAFDAAFLEESAAMGHPVPGRDVLALLAGDLRPRVVGALRAIAGRFRTGCITNNAPSGHGAGMAATAGRAREMAEVFALFDHVLESAKLGLRKPDPRIYALMCEALGVEARACVFIDDLGINLKPARQMGMRTIKALDEAQILADLSRETGMDLAGTG